MKYLQWANYLSYDRILLGSNNSIAWFSLQRMELRGKIWCDKTGKVSQIYKSFHIICWRTLSNSWDFHECWLLCFWPRFSPYFASAASQVQNNLQIWPLCVLFGKTEKLSLSFVSASIAIEEAASNETMLTIYKPVLPLLTMYRKNIRWCTLPSNS